MVSAYLTLALLATTAFAAPFLESGEISCGSDELYVVEKNGRTLHWPVPSLFGNTTGCVPKPASARAMQNPYDSTVETTDGTITTGEVCWNCAPEFPAQFGQMWDEIKGAACGATFCEGSVTRQSIMPFGGDITMSVRGNFAGADGVMRDNFFAMAREAFYRAVEQRRDAMDAVYEDGPELMFVTSGFGDASGHTLRVEFSLGEDKRSCPDVVNGINALGSLVPQLAPIFGFAGAICAFIG